jgi:hypothetical protein
MVRQSREDGKKTKAKKMGGEDGEDGKTEQRRRYEDKGKEDGR